MMKLIIELPEAIKEYIQNNDCLSAIYEAKVLEAIANGTPVPKGHGDIVDIGTLIDMFWDGNSMEITNSDLSRIEPIIEADKGKEGGTE